MAAVCPLSEPLPCRGRRGTAGPCRNLDATVPAPFSPTYPPIRRADVFSYGDVDIDEAARRPALPLRLDGQAFVETVARRRRATSGRTSAHEAARLVHLLAGVSYYKAGAARTIDLGDDARAARRAGVPPHRSTWTGSASSPTATASHSTTSSVVGARRRTHRRTATVGRRSTAAGRSCRSAAGSTRS